MSKREEIARYGNFIVTHDKGKDYEYIAIRAISGVWSVSFRSDNPMFGCLLDFIRHDELKMPIEMLCYINYMCGSIVPDAAFVEGFVKLVEEYNERLIANREQPTAEKEKEAIDDVNTAIRISEIAKQVNELQSNETADR